MKIEYNPFIYNRYTSLKPYLPIFKQNHYGHKIHEIHGIVYLYVLCENSIHQYIDTIHNNYEHMYGYLFYYLVIFERFKGANYVFKALCWNI